MEAMEDKMKIEKLSGHLQGGALLYVYYPHVLYMSLLMAK